jgi:nitroreductase
MTAPTALSPQPWPEAPAADAGVAARMQWYPHVARLAPSKHNTQPWRFVARADALELWADLHRALPASDPLMRELVISCGAALHHVEVAMRALGRLPRVEVLPHGGSSLLARVTEAADHEATTHDQLMLAAVAERRTDRGPLDVRALPLSLPFQLQSAAAVAGASLRLITSAGDRATFASLVERADRILVRDGRFEHEMSHWLRHRDDPRPDGVPQESTRGASASYRAEFVQRDFSGGSGGSAHDRPGVDHPLLAVLCTPGDQVADWVAAGRALSAVLLEATTVGGQASYLNQPVEVSALRAQLRADLRLEGEPQMVLRLGAGGAVHPTPRRPVEEIRFDA